MADGVAPSRGAAGPPGSVGGDLRAAREAAGMSLDDVSAAVRVRRSVLAAMERDDFTGCGGDVYARGHLRSIARAVGADEGALLARYAAEQGAPAPSAAQVLAVETVPRRERSGPQWQRAVVVVLVVIAALAGVQLALSHRHSARTSAPPVGSPSASQTPAASASPTPSRTVIAAVPAPTGVTVQLTVTNGESWVSATEGAAQSFAGIIAAPQVKVFTDPQLVRLVIGNAAAVSLVVNGHNLGTPGTSGQVLRLSFGPGNPTLPG